MNTRRKPRPYVLQWNVRSLRPRHADLVLRLLAMNTPPDVIALQETNVRQDELRLPGYVGVHSNARCTAPACGSFQCTDATHPRNASKASLYIRADLHFSVIDASDICDADFECAAAAVSLRDTITTVASIYFRPTRSSDITLLECLVSRCGPSFLLCGDFNAHHPRWCSRPQDNRGVEINELIVKRDLQTLNDGSSTFVGRGKQQSTIDLAISTRDVCLAWSREADPWGSDHLPIWLVPEHSPSRQSAAYTVTNWDKFRRLIAGAPSHDNLFKLVSECLQQATVRRLRGIDKPNPDLKLLRLRACRRRAYRRAQRSKRSSDWTLYNRLDAAIRRHTKQLRRRSWAALCSSLHTANGLGSVWRILKALRTPEVCKNPTAAICITTGRSPQILAEEFADLFASPMSRDNANGDLNSLTSDNSLTIFYGPPCEMDQADFTLVELRHALSLSYRRTAPGEDGVTYQALRNIDEAFHQGILDEYNKVWRTCLIPIEWKSSVVKPILKPGRPAQHLKSYRPISLTSNVMKLMERMVLFRLDGRLQELAFFPEVMSGFRRHRSALDSIADLASSLESARANRHSAYVLFLDIQQAFDSVLHKALVTAGISGRLLHFVRDFLSERRMKVRVGEATSEYRIVNCGVPQGSVLSPLLFNSVLAGLPSRLPQECDFPLGIAIYADDIALWVSGPSHHGPRLRGILQRALNATSEYLEEAGLQISPAKSAAIAYHPRQRARRSMSRLHLGDTPIQWVQQHRYLGVIIDDRLSWRPAVASVRRKSLSLLKYVAALTARGDGIDQTTALQVYQSSILSCVMYALPVLNVAPGLMSQLERDHRVALRVVLGLPREAQSIPLLTEAHQLPLRLQADQRALHHIERMHRASDGKALVNRLIRRPLSRMGKMAALFIGITGNSNKTTSVTTSKEHSKCTFPIHLAIPGIRKKCDQPVPALFQLAQSHLFEEFGDYVKVFTDASVRSDGLGASAAFFCPSTDIRRVFKIPHPSSSVTAELAAIDVALKYVQERLTPSKVVILTDSRGALSRLTRKEADSPILCSIMESADKVLSRGVSLAAQWIPSHVGIAGNEEADRLASSCNHDDCDCPEISSMMDNARLLIRRHLLKQHPDQRVANGSFPPRVRGRGLPRRSRALLYKLRVGSVLVRERLFRQGRVDSPLCAACGSCETLEHLILHCPAFVTQRALLIKEYKFLGFKCATMDDYLFPRGCVSRRDQAHRALLTFMDQTDLATRL